MHYVTVLVHEKLAISVGVTIVRGRIILFFISTGRFRSNHALGSSYTILGSFSPREEVVNSWNYRRSKYFKSFGSSFFLNPSRLWIVFRTVPLMVKLSMIKGCETVFYFLNLVNHFHLWIYILIGDLLHSRCINVFYFINLVIYW